MRRLFPPRVRFALSAVAALVLAALLGPVRAEVSGRPRLAEDLERRLDGFFIFVTDGSGTYEVFQRVETRRGLSAEDEIVCMTRECFVAVARGSATVLANKRNLEAVRSRFRMTRDAYDALQRASGDEVLPMTGAWRQAGKRLQGCLDDDAAC